MRAPRRVTPVEMASTNALPQPFLRLRGKSFMSVVLTPDLPPERWLHQLDDQIARSPKVFEGRLTVRRRGGKGCAAALTTP